MHRQSHPPNGKNRLRRSGWLLLGVLSLVLACGYHFTPGGENIDKAIQTIYVDNFVNSTSEANVELYLRASFIEQIIQHPRFKVNDDAVKADALLKGSIKALSRAPLSYTAGSANQAAEERLTVVMDLTLSERESKKVIWSDANFTQTQDYIIQNVNVTELNRRNALIKLCSDGAERAYRAMLSGF